MARALMLMGFHAGSARFRKVGLVWAGESRNVRGPPLVVIQCERKGGGGKIAVIFEARRFQKPCPGLGAQISKGKRT